jgi:uncharacterized protein (DUF2141 family)
MRSALWAILVSALSPAAALAGDLTVKIDNVRSESGSILAALYDSESSFMKQPSARATFKLRAQQGEVEYVFHDLPPGEYALSVFHDENGNGRLDTNFLGMPKEGYGFSNGARGRYGPPTFRQSAFMFDGTTGSITIALQY